MTTYLQLSKQFLTRTEIHHLNGHVQPKQLKETHQLLLSLVKSLKLPLRVLQTTLYLLQKTLLFINPGLQELAITCLFISTKSNDFIIKLQNLLHASLALTTQKPKKEDLEELKKRVLSLERKVMEIQGFDFRQYNVEELLVKFIKLYQSKELLDDQQAYLAWCITNDLYFTRLILILPAHYCAIIALHLARLINNELGMTKYRLEYNLLQFRPDMLKVKEGCNLLLEYYIDNLSSTFMFKSIKEQRGEDSNLATPKTPVTPATPSTNQTSVPTRDPLAKEVQNALLNIKIELAVDSKIGKLSEDLYYKNREEGSIRFMYNRGKYEREVYNQKP